LKERQ
jgi:hypothetical protein